MTIPTGDKAHRDLMEAQRRWERARTEVENARANLNNAIRASILTQTEIGHTLGWPRQRVNTILRGVTSTGH